MCFSFFKSDKPKDDFYYKLGGPRSIHKYSYKNSKIIFMGELHNKMNSILTKKYLDIFQKEFENNPEIKLFIENDKDSRVQKESSELSFIDCLQKSAFIKAVKIN